MLRGRIILYTYHKETKNGYPVKIRLSDGRVEKTRYINTGYYAYDGQWKNEEPLPNHPQYNEIMLDVLEWRKKLFELLPKANRENWSLDKVVLQFKQKGGFNAWEFVRELEDVSGNTKALYKAALKSYERFAGHFNIESINDIDVERYIKHQRRNLTNNGINMYLSKLNAIINKAIKLGHYSGGNPFSSKLLPYEKTPNPILTDEDMVKIRDADFQEGSQAWHYRNYFMLLFYLGGIYTIDLANLRYDKHVFDGRIEFKRHKGGTNEFVSNKILPEAKAILDLYDCRPYLVPIFKYENYTTFRGNFIRRFAKYCESLNLTRKPITKTARYTFINRAKEMLIDERITMELVGHAGKGTHSLYQDEFPYHVRDEAHRSIIEF